MQCKCPPTFQFRLKSWEPVTSHTGYPWLTQLLFLGRNHQIFTIFGLYYFLANSFTTANFWTITFQNVLKNCSCEIHTSEVTVCISQGSSVFYEIRPTLPGMYQRHPFSRVASSTGNHSPTNFNGSLYKKVPSWWGVTWVPIRGCLKMYIPWRPSIYYVKTFSVFPAPSHFLSTYWGDCWVLHSHFGPVFVLQIGK